MSGTDQRGFPVGDGPVQRQWTVPCPVCKAESDQECTGVNTGCVLDHGHMQRHIEQRKNDADVPPHGCWKHPAACASWCGAVECDH